MEIKVPGKGKKKWFITIETIARLSGKREGTVRQDLFRGKLKLKRTTRELDKEDLVNLIEYLQGYSSE